jgi:predicted HicB family RNase H-like nuclease
MMKTTQDKLTVRFPFGLLDALRVLAEAHKRSLNSEIIWALQNYVQQQAKNRTKGN